MKCLALFLFFASVEPLLAQLYSYRSPEGKLVITDRPISNDQYKLIDKYISPEAKKAMAEARRRNSATSGNQLSWTQIDGLVTPIAKAYKVDPDLVKAIIEVESSRDPYAKSHKGAEGLMQLIPDTARRFNVRNSYDPRQNIKGGVQYLRFLLGYFEGNVDHVLAAYNAGEYAVDKHRGVPPYKETRRYIQKVRRFFDKAHVEYDPQIAYRSVLIPGSGKPAVKPVARKEPS